MSEEKREWGPTRHKTLQRRWDDETLDRAVAAIHKKLTHPATIPLGVMDYCSSWEFGPLCMAARRHKRAERGRVHIQAPGIKLAHGKGTLACYLRIMIWEMKHNVGPWRRMR